MIFLGSCTGISFDPDYALPNLKEEMLIHEDGREIPFQSREMLDYACMNKDKVKELAEILQSANLKGYNAEVLKIYQAIIRNQQ